MYAAGVLGKAWPRSFLQLALLPVVLVSDNLAVPTIAGAPFDSSKRLMEKSVRMPQSKVEIPKEEPKTALKDDFIENIIQEKESGKRNKMKAFRTGNVLGEDVFYGR